MTAYVLAAYTFDGEPCGEQRRFANLPIRIGRNPMNDFPIAHPVVSGFHARMDDVDGTLCIVDLGSTNGTHVPVPGSSPRAIPANQPMDLSSVGFQFFLGAQICVRVQLDEVRDALEHRVNANPLAVGDVLGNRNVLLESQAPPPPPRVAPVPGFHQAPVPVQHFDEEGPALETRSLQMSIDVMALQGLRELATSLVPGVALDTSGDVARFITKLHDALEVFCRSFIPLRDGYLQFTSSLDLRQRGIRTAARSPSYRGVESAQTPEALAQALLNPKDRAFDAPHAVEGILADLMRHQLALLEGVMGGVRALLEELSPENIERNAGASLPLGRYKALWQAYCQIFEDLSEERQTFSRIFGADFTAAYRKHHSGQGGGTSA